MTLTQRDVFKRTMTEWLKPPKAIHLLMGHTLKRIVRSWRDAHPKYVPRCPHKNGEFRLTWVFQVARLFPKILVKLYSSPISSDAHVDETAAVLRSKVSGTKVHEQHLIVNVI